jgi:hypothetical protein
MRTRQVMRAPGQCSPVRVMLHANWYTVKRRILLLSLPRVGNVDSSLNLRLVWVNAKRHPSPFDQHRPHVLSKCTHQMSKNRDMNELQSGQTEQTILKPWRGVSKGDVGLGVQGSDQQSQQRSEGGHGVMRKMVPSTLNEVSFNNSKYVLEIRSPWPQCHSWLGCPP